MRRAFLGSIGFQPKTRGNLRRCFALAVMIFGATCVSAFSQETSEYQKRFYVLGSVGIVDFNVEGSDLQDVDTDLVNLGFASSRTSTDDEGVMFKIGAGFDFSKYVSIEGGYTDLGTLEIKTATTGPSENFSLDIEPDGFEISGLLKYNINDQALVFGRVGLLFWEADATISSSLGSIKVELDDGTDITLGIGLEYSFFRIEYQYYKLGDEDLNTFQFSLVYKF